MREICGRGGEEGGQRIVGSGAGWFKATKCSLTEIGSAGKEVVMVNSF